MIQRIFNNKPFWVIILRPIFSNQTLNITQDCLRGSLYLSHVLIFGKVIAALVRVFF